jgi:hypothetical protein
MSADEILRHLQKLELERLEAECAGLMASEHYRRDFRDEVATYRTAFVGAAVTEIAALRAELWGRQAG